MENSTSPKILRPSSTYFRNHGLRFLTLNGDRWLHKQLLIFNKLKGYCYQVKETDLEISHHVQPRFQWKQARNNHSR
ncbi:hypothetical protein TNIN_52301 [Trichonephila inaurata madagascariensis]|uniref:Uncharacterized protein n=1 Tax=Trichonephila inaurata madagascariensis TaxID=2747483 RepID=A0A8X6IAY4_9ARAC|nr:hypothetical protein TNIN_52301 [Trichonephila inaurata madagascariensis]